MVFLKEPQSTGFFKEHNSIIIKHGIAFVSVQKYDQKVFACVTAKKKNLK